LRDATQREENENLTNHVHNEDETSTAATTSVLSKLVTLAMY